MGYFDKLAQNSFKETSAGDILYYPHGAMGKGRVVPDEATKEKLVTLRLR